ncbi:MAG TPA: response regulator [Flavobacterium sp.]|jgi:CheY-like chemotaxis protein
MVTMRITPHFFYVDNDSEDLALFGEVAKQVGQKVRTFNIGETLLDALHSSAAKPSMILVDLNMPLMTGYDVIREICAAENLKHLPIVAYSTASDIVITSK